MQKKQIYLLQASFAFLLFVLLGYLVKFYPESLVSFDTSIQTEVRADLPANVTQFFKLITLTGNVATQFGIVVILAIFFYLKKWYVESAYVAINGVVAGLLVMTLKLLYQRVRPTITHLVFAGGYSFPSGHSMGSMIIIGTLIIVVHQRLKKGILRFAIECLLGLLISLVGLSRIYLGVHFPSDVLGGFILGYGVLCLGFPYYDKRRFNWRFRGKQP
ncbi:hypothetical protein HMPREF9318_02026 [Streptococcus urinalis FB127-CNA-2]|uniref:PAP2 family protein n=1 Tax=Streptococcus urinalis 2285-97 TaxID=764291 RepID=G5KCL1_9STRE|nr:phosphatase PAP2 family protein [Streptococcus urinalis]EHJ56364.1 PAP2 family protein [Streptococcus urinalis 2285-97]EKS17149.1 hypothetical protein HMPREF9318_02026 [Streptococcus urinalis FB127-CNA-2]VEF32601.1 phosphatidylglycerophosphatase B [Streptococcus urinalis]